MASNLSQFDRVVVMPTSTAPRTTVAAAPPPAFPQPPPFPQQTPTPDDDVDDDRAAATVAVPVPNPRGPIFNTFQQPQVVNPAGQPPMMVGPNGQVMPQLPVPTEQQPPTAYPSTPTAPFGGVAVPGMIVPTPQPNPAGQPGQIVPPVQQAQPRRPGGQ
jgi:hypothetical protein